MTRHLFSAIFYTCVLGILLSTDVVAQNYSGYIDIADCSIIAGWAWDANQPNTSISVDIYDGDKSLGGTLVTTASASSFRQDLYNAGYGNGNHGYNFTTPASLKNNQYHYIYVYYHGTSLQLYNSDEP